MESGDFQDQNQGFQHDYDDEHDSDVEARLYAEVYYSNTIIGEENINSSTSENQCTDVLNGINKNNGDNEHLLHSQNTNQQNSDGSTLHDGHVAKSSDSTNNSVQDANQESNGQDINNPSNKLVSSQRASNSSNIPNSKKRMSNGCLDETNKCSKKRKHDNQNGMRESQPSQQKSDATQINDGSLVNPYNKNVTSNTQKGMKLMDPKLISPEISSRKRKKDHALKKNKSKGGSACNVMPSTDTTLQLSNITTVKPTENNHEENVTLESSVIDISSESSNESCEDDSKYNTIVATDKKLRRRESGLRNTNAHDTSDSEESILEVPIPPKPAPPLIEVKDSDNEHEDPNESDKDISLNDSLNLQETTVQNNHEISLDSSMDKTQDTCEIILDSDDSNSLILNCTQVQKGVSSLSEIKKMNQQTSQDNCSTSQNQCSQNKPESFKSHSNSKTKQTSVRSSKNMSAEEYFFQPMTERMTSFYNDSWGGENFDMDQIKSSMSRDPNKWAILNKDLVLTGPRKKRYFGMTCARCHKDGHRQNDCPEPNKGPTCYMCGANGHFATYCPHTKCLTCGSKQTMYRTSCGYCEKLFCTRCRSQGHREASCPDLWRRYHHTTNSAAPKIPLNVKNVMKSRHELVCCNCTKQGHDSMACRKLRWSQHFPNPSFVTHYNGPIYNTVTSIDPSLVADHMQARSCNLFNNSPNSNNLFSNSVPSKTLPTSFPRSDRRNENLAQNELGSSSNVSNAEKNVIFHILGTKPKSIDVVQSVKSVTLKFNVPNESNSNLVDSWKKLSNFLKGLSDITAVFRLVRKDKHLLMYITCSRKYIECLSTLIKQYENRNDLERSQMLLSSERTLKVIVEHLSRKFAEMKNLNEDILSLYEKISSLREEFSKEGHIQNKVDNRLKLNELVSSQQKLSMLLYREGFGDESLGQLRKMFLKMEKVMEKHSDERKTKKKSRFGSVALISLKFLITYLYYYNNIFVPCESKKLDIYIQKYKDNLDRRNKLMNSSVLFPEKTNEKQDDSNDATTQSCTSNEKSSGNSSDPLPSTSQELPILQSTAMETSKDIITNNSSSPISGSPNVTLQTQKSDKNLNGLYLQAVRAKTPALQDILMKNFRNYLKNTRNCLQKASKLNSPRLHDDILDLQRDLEDETHLSTKKVRKFKKKVHEESLRLQGVTKKIPKSLEKSNANRTYKRFCASL